MLVWASRQTVRRNRWPLTRACGGNAAHGGQPGDGGEQAGQHRCRGHPRHPPAEQAHEQQVEQHVDRIAAYLHEQGGPDAGLPHEPSQYGVVQQREGSRPDQDIVIGSGYFSGGRIKAQQEHGTGKDGIPAQEDAGAQQQGHDARQKKGLPGGLRIPGGQGLRAEPRGAHAQEAQQPVQGVEDDRPHGHSRDIGGVGKAPHDGRIHGADERLRHRGKDEGQQHGRIFLAGRAWHGGGRLCGGKRHGVAPFLLRRWPRNVPVRCGPYRCRVPHRCP